ncbi:MULTISPECIES: LpqN/LpqT family lipoprotein [unclassified Mycobacterium]|uniref:LpqN/LpqT family lipoprotein n=1 Tax=unclassified Mycobacterium TaxID=2642494 RepID=UPI0009938B12|nr:MULTISPECIES: LpqN/LpqT family lipoprotein [unclassified Mycobacterium]
MTTKRYSVRFAAATASVAALLAGTTAIALADPQPVPPAPVATPNAATSAPVAPAAAPTASTNPLQPSAPISGLAPANEGTLAEFFASKNVKLEPLTKNSHGAPRISIPIPNNWANVPDPNVPNAYQVIVSKANGTGLYQSNAQVTMSKLVGEFDTNEAVSHGPVEVKSLQGWQPTDASLVTYQGAPSSIVEGTFRQDGETLNTSRRAAIITQGKDRYLVQLAVTTTVGNAIAEAPATDLIVNGLRFGDAAPVTAPAADPNALADPDAVPGAPVTPAPGAPVPADPNAPPSPAPGVPGLPPLPTLPPLIPPAPPAA